jgi:hypothetical protein
MKRLDPPPPEIWEVRVTLPRPQARLLGRFAGPDTLILTHLHTRTHLGDRDSANWKQALTQCASIWKEMFDPLEPFSGPNVHSYITENCDDFSI